MPDPRRFVVQRHETDDGVHWDLMLEQAEGLATWRVPVPPEQIAAEPLAIERIVDHPKRFLAYEGPLRSHPGRVSIHDQGTYVVRSRSDNVWVVSIEGRLMAGVYRLSREMPCPEGAEGWRAERVKRQRHDKVTR